MTLSSTTIFATFCCEGTLYIDSKSTFSRIERNPLAPVLRSIARSATARSPSSLQSISTPSISNILAYCLVRALRGSVKMRTKASTSSSSSVAITGNRPTNSGIRPYWTKSSGSRSEIISPKRRVSSLLLTSAVNPMPPFSERLRIILSSPAKAPPQINRMLLVSTCKNSCCGCFRPPWGGTEATVPSISFNKACCTPSPETSRVMEGLSDLREILSISSM